MIKIAVCGHSPDAFPDAKSLAHDIDNAIAIIKRQHGLEKDFKFLLSCDPGAGQWFCNALMEHGLPYEVYLSSPPDETSKYWSEEQQERFIWQLSGSVAIHVFDVDNSPESRIKRDKKVIDDSQWVLVFWNKRHQGFTYRAMEYALKSNKIVFNGINGLTLVDGRALEMNVKVE
jgi:hypothetical protein